MLQKLLSGRYLLTVAAAFVFVYAVITKLIGAAETVAILMFVFQAYFDRKDRENNTTKGA